MQIAEISLPSAPEVTSNESESEIEEKEEKPIDAEMEVSYQIMENYTAIAGEMSSYTLI